MRTVLAITAGLVFSALCVAAMAADSVTLTASVDRDEVALGDTFSYILEIASSMDAQPSQIRLPDFRGFDEGGRSQSEQISMSMGAGGRGFQRTRQIRVTLTATKTGVFEIPAAAVVLKGNRYESKPVRVTVVQASKAPNQQRQAGRPARQGFPFDDDFFGMDPGFGRKAQIGKDDVFLRAGFDRRTAYEGERLMYAVRLYTRVQVSQPSLALPKFEGFWNEDVTPSRNYIDASTADVNGVKYQVYEIRKVALSPLRAGRLAIEPATIELSAGGVFGRAIRRASDPVAIDVIPLPAAGRPSGFEPGNVGQFTFRSELSSNVTGLDKPVTASFIVSGSGNMRSVKIPKIDFGSSFRSYDPTVTDSYNSGNNTGERRWDYLLIPASAGVHTVPPVTFDYFDPAAAAYRSITTEPMDVTVSASAPAVPIGTGAGSKGTGLAAGLRPLRYRGDLAPSNPSWYASWWVWILMMIAPASWAATTIAGWIRALLRRETPLSAQRRALRHSRRRLKVAGAMLKGQNPPPAEFYGELSKAINGSISSRIGREPSGMTREQLAAALSATGLGGDLVGMALSELESCDFARFAPAASEPAGMKAAFGRTVQLIAGLEGRR